MKRRDFSMGAAGAAALSFGGVGVGAQAQGAKPVAGTHYLVVDPKAPVDAPAGKVEVVEFFWYNCPHCSAFEPTLEAWLKRLPKDIAFRRVPIAFNESFAPQQRLYFALEAMGLVEKLHAKVFAAIHGERLNLTKSDAIAEWVSRQGVDKAKFMDQYNSFTTATKANRATQLQNAYKLDGVPALGVGGRFLTDGPMAGNMDRALQIVESLVTDLHASRT
jgi:protein dithiol oxidoreductase (disulfide-forming)